jgi:lysophospholipase L1-like esterase
MPVVFAAVLAVEVQLARNGPDLLDDTPLQHDGRVGGDGPALRMVWLGDSTAAGVGASSADGAMPRRVASALGRPVDLTVLAVSGDRVADVVDDQVEAVAALRPDVVLVSIGANDVVHLTSNDAFRDSYEQVLDAIPEGTTVVLLGVPDMGAPPRFAQPLRAVAGWRGRHLERIAREVADEAGVLFVDIAGETGPEMRADTGRTFAIDKYHPSDAGYALWADAVVEVIAPALAELVEEVR